MTIADQRDAVRFLATKGISVRRACLLAQLDRATFQYQARVRPDEEALLADIAELAQRHSRAAATQTHHQSQARPAALEARTSAGQACSAAATTSHSASAAIGGLSQSCLGL